MIVKFTKDENGNLKVSMEEYKPDQEELNRIAILDSLENDFHNLEKITDKWGYLRQIYMEMLPWIMERAKENIVVPVNPYPVDWSRYFSPIEAIAWNSIRSHYMALYPQFPVFNYFIDFANPYLRIGLELDGKDFHDSEKDKLRDQLLYRHGWRIFRVTGSECYHKYKPYEEIISDYQEHHQDEEQKQREIDDWMCNSCDGVVKAIKLIYFQKDENSKLFRSACRTLDNHKGADFDILIR